MRRKRQSVRVNEAKKDIVLREEGKDVIIFDWLNSDLYCL